MAAFQDLDGDLSSTSAKLSVYSSDGEQIGSITDVIENRMTGRPAYAVVGYANQVGTRVKTQNLAWGSLYFDGAKNGYVSHLTSTEFDRHFAKADVYCRDSQMSEKSHCPNDVRIGMWS